MYLSVTGRVNEVIGDGVGGDIYTHPPEYCRPVYRHLVDTGAIYSSRATSGGAGVDDMMGSGLNQTRAGRDGDGDGYGGGGGRLGWKRG